MLKHEYGEAKPLADMLLTSMSKEKWYRLLHTYLQSVREHVGHSVSRPSDIPRVAYQAICSVIFCVPLASGDVKELKDVGKLLVKLCGKEIDASIQEKGYSSRLLQGKADMLHYVDVHIVSLYPTGDWQTNPEERYDLVLNMCLCRNIAIRDMDCFRRVMLGGLSSAGHSVSSKTSLSERKKSVAEEEEEQQQQQYCVPEVPDEKPFEEEVFLNGTKKGRQKKKSAETWETVFDKQQSSHGDEEVPHTPPPPPSVVTTHDGWQVAYQDPTMSPGSSGGSGGGISLPPVMSIPGWSPPKPRLDDMYSFGRKLDNVGEYMKNNTTTNSQD